MNHITDRTTSAARAARRQERNRTGAGQRRRRSAWGEVRLGALAGLVLGLALVGVDDNRIGFGGIAGAAEPVGAARVAGEAVAERRFGLCFTGGGTDCVVDGDTLWIDGEKVRVADIDTPETHPPRCDEEARLGEAATLRMQALLNAGPVTLVAADRATDRYGRRLAVVERGGVSLGATLVAEGLARRWEGRRRPWCGV
jgi:micrococcal nuclease